jgi:hypothetical protein
MIQCQLRRICSLVAFALLIAIGGASFARAATWSTTDVYTGAPLPSGVVSVKNAAGSDVTVTWQVGNYLSDGLRIFGLLCTPPTTPPHPVALLNHGLEPDFLFIYLAIEQNGFEGCTTMAGYGWLTAITTYRDEVIGTAPGLTILGKPVVGLPPPHKDFMGRSDGWLELCGGEVRDVINLLSEVTALPSAVSGTPLANPSQVLMWGHSHGSCITERAIESGAKVQVAVSIDGPTDFMTWKNYAPWLAPTLPAKEARSSAWPGNSPSMLANVKFLRIQAEDDMVVPAVQGCELAFRIPLLANYYVDPATGTASSQVIPGSPPSGSPPACLAFTTIPWPKTPLPDETGGSGAWASPILLMYHGLNPLVAHVTILERSWPEFSSFVNAFVGGWNNHPSIPAQPFPLEN